MSDVPPSDSPESTPTEAWPPPGVRLALEGLGVALLLFAALFPRLRDFAAEFDREFDGWQGAFFAISAINYEREGVGEHLGYPVQDLDAAGEDEVTLYANHPPAVPLVAWAAAKAMGPQGWDSAWREHRAPEGLEPVLRLPFLLAHVASLIFLYLAVREAAGMTRAMLTLAIAAALPVWILYATLVNYENPALALVLAAAWFAVRYAKRGARSDLVAFGASALVGCAVTFFHLFYLPGLVLLVATRDRGRALRLALAGGAGALVPLAAHALLSAAAFEALGRRPDLLAERVGQMLAPLLDGSIPLTDWLAFQVERGLVWFSSPIAFAAAIGAVLALAAPFRPRRSADEVELALPLLSGGVLLLVVMYRHTADGWNGGDGQVPFLLYLAPGVALCASLVLHRLARPLARLRGGLAPLVVATSLLAIPGVQRASELRWERREPGPADDSNKPDGPDVPLPATAGRELARLVPPGEVALVPRALGFTPAHLYYSWRTLVPVDPADRASTATAMSRMAARGRDAWLVLPIEAEGELRVQSEALFAAVAAAVPGADRDAPDRSGERYAAWRLPAD